jgi:hypothetical protein
MSLPLFLFSALAACAVDVAGAEESEPSSRSTGGEKKEGEEGRGASSSFGNDIETVPYPYRSVGQPRELGCRRDEVVKWLIS